MKMYKETYDLVGEMDEFEFAYEQALMTVRAIDEVRALRRENEELRNEIADNRKNIDNQYKQTRVQMANILTGLMNKSEKEAEEE